MYFIPHRKPINNDIVLLNYMFYFFVLIITLCYFFLSLIYLLYTFNTKYYKKKTGKISFIGTKKYFIIHNQNLFTVPSKFIYKYI